MIDKTKRTTLKAMSVAAVAALTPGMAAARSATRTTVTRKGLDISIEANGPHLPATLVISNPTTDSVALKHVSPGLVKSKGQLFDINTLLKREPVTVAAGEARRFAIDPVDSAYPVETPVPGGVIAPDMVAVSTRYDSSFGERMTTTRRMLLT